MKEITKGTLCRLLAEIGYDFREDRNGGFWGVRYADGDFPHDVVYSISLDGEWLHVTGCAQGFGPAEEDEYAVLEVLNQMNMKRVDPVGFYLNCQPQFRHSTRLGQEMSKEFVKHDGISYGIYCIQRCFAELGNILKSRGINTKSPF